ncbi:MAG TPA: hypothetical protein VEP90_12570 [Methylomirabilota bacterium]|nr:hypothetical protein [Methylomirabilota bacterium]
MKTSAITKKVTFEDVASMEAESAGVTLARAEIAHPRSGLQNECEQEILGGMSAFLFHHEIDKFSETNVLHIQRKGSGMCSDCGAYSEWLFNYGPFLYWRKCLEHLSSHEKELHDLFWESNEW